MANQLSREEKLLELENRIITLENDIEKRKKSEIYIEINPNFFVTCILIFIFYYFMF